MTEPSTALRERFLVSAHVTLDRMRQFAVLLARDPRDANALDNLRRDLHRLRGSAGSYGFTAASDRLSGMEERVVEWMLDPTMQAAQRGTLVRQLVDALHTHFGADAVARAEAAGHDIWCVDTPPDRTAEWSQLAATAGVRFTLLHADDFAAQLQQRPRPYAVIAPAEVGRGLPVPDGLPLVLLAGGTVAPLTSGRAFGAVTLVDRNISADDLLVLIEHLELRTTVAGGSVVILDDDPTILLLTKAICRDAGLRAVTIEDPNELFPVLERERPAVLLMDVNLPGTSGFELCRAVRASEEFRDIPVILFSANVSSEARDAAVVAGADGFLAKPVAAAELRSQLRSRVEQVRVLRLSHGLNPATGLPDLVHGERDAEPLFGALRRSGGVLSAALVRLRHADAEATLQWPNHCVRIARAARAAGALVAHYDQISLVLTAREGHGLLLEAIASAHDPAHGDVPWAVGLAEAAEAGAAHPADLWFAAGDAVRAALERGAPSHAWTPADSTRAPDVIIVEDDVAFSELLEYLLQKDGFTFRVVRNGLDALDLLRALPVGSHKPLVVLDLDLPGLDGHSVHEQIRLERPGDYVFVMVSVRAGEADQVRAIRAGADDYLVKPVSLRVLMSKLPRWVRRPRASG